MAQLSVTGLRVVREVARRGSFSAAAESLGYTQSAVSRQIALMEQAAGQALFVRHARGTHLTDAGRVVVRHADAVLAELESTRQDLDDLSGRPAGRLRLGAFSTALGALVPRAIAAFRSDRANVEVVLREGTSDRLLARVADGRLDLAVVTPPDKIGGDEFRITTLLEDPLLLCVARDHRLATETVVPADELRDEPWVAGSTEARSTLLGAWRGSDWEPDIAYVAREWTAKLGLVAAGLGVTVVPGLALPALPPAVAVVRIDHPAAQRTTAMAARGDGGHNPHADALAESLRDDSADLAAEIRQRLRG